MGALDDGGMQSTLTRQQSGHPVYKGSGLVDGQIMNAFSLSESQGYLRIATTERPIS